MPLSPPCNSVDAVYQSDDYRTRCDVCTTAARSEVLCTTVVGASNAFCAVDRRWHRFLGLESLSGCLGIMAEDRSQETWSRDIPPRKPAHALKRHRPEYHGRQRGKKLLPPISPQHRNRNRNRNRFQTRHVNAEERRNSRLSGLRMRAGYGGVMEWSRHITCTLNSSWMVVSGGMESCREGRLAR